MRYRAERLEELFFFIGGTPSLQDVEDVNFRSFGNMIHKLGKAILYCNGEMSIVFRRWPVVWKM